MNSDTSRLIASHLLPDCPITAAHHQLLIDQLLTLCSRDAQCVQQNMARLYRLCELRNAPLLQFQERFNALINSNPHLLEQLERSGMLQGQIRRRYDASVAANRVLSWFPTHRNAAAGRVGFEVGILTRQRGIFVLEYIPAFGQIHVGYDDDVHNRRDRYRLHRLRSILEELFEDRFVFDNETVELAYPFEVAHDEIVVATDVEAISDSEDED